MLPKVTNTLDFNPLPADPRKLTLAHVRSAFPGDVDAVLRDIVRLTAATSAAPVQERGADELRCRSIERHPYPKSVPVLSGEMSAKWA